MDDIIVAANGFAFTSPRIRKGVLPRMLREILETRVMVKGAMKGTKQDRILQRRRNARQFALKLIANVTYGYTAAGTTLPSLSSSERAHDVGMLWCFQLGLLFLFGLQGFDTKLSLQCRHARHGFASWLVFQGGPKETTSS